MGDKTWKAMERRCAQDLNTQRVVCSGVRGEGDIIHDDFYIECKYRKTLGVKTWFDKAKEEAKKQGKTPILIVKEHGQHGELAVVDWNWLVEKLIEVKE